MLFDEEKNNGAKVQSCNLNEELGMVHYIFSDKTGTLTKNIMDFKKFTAGEYSYGVSNPSPREYEPGITNINFECPLFERDWTEGIKEKGKPANPLLETMILILGVCHTVVVEKKDENIVYNASSPDELALVNAARHFGLTFIDRDDESNIILHNKFTGKNIKYELLNVIEFTSTRKRMSVIVRAPDNKIMIFTKGADTIILPRIAHGQEFLVDKTLKYIKNFAVEGLRTLLVVQKEVSSEFYNEWS